MKQPFFESALKFSYSNVEFQKIFRDTSGSRFKGDRNDVGVSNGVSEGHWTMPPSLNLVHEIMSSVNSRAEDDFRFRPDVRMHKYVFIINCSESCYHLAANDASTGKGHI